MAILAVDLAGKDYRSLFIWSGILVVLMLVGYGLYSYFIKWVKDSDEEVAQPGFTLSELRQLVKQGKMTEAEYEQAKVKMVAAAKKMTENVTVVRGRRREGPGSPAGEVQPKGTAANDIALDGSPSQDPPPEGVPPA